MLEHPTRILHRRLSSLAPYPKGVVAVPEPRIEGNAFFPGGDGLWKADRKTLPAFPEAGIMVLGHDFHSRSGFEKSRQRGGEADSPTWTNLLDLFEEVRIVKEQCFFTNFFMGLREADATMGAFPGRKDPQFVGRCQEFLKVQLELVKPRLIITLGRFVPPEIAKLSNDLDCWKEVRSFADIDSKSPVVAMASFFEGLQKATVVALTHPSMRKSNIKRRRYHGRSGSDAEFDMMRAAMSHAGISCVGQPKTVS